MDITGKFKLFLEEEDTYIQVPSSIILDLENNKSMLEEYTRVYKLINKLKEDISNFIFDRESKVSSSSIGYQFMKIKSDQSLSKVQPFLDTDINDISAKLEKIIPYFGIDIDEINSKREEIKNDYVMNSYRSEEIIDSCYISEIIEHIKISSLYTLKSKSRYGSIVYDGILKNKEDIKDFNEKEIGGKYSPILVIYRPAKYYRGQYILEDIHHVYIKRQPLEALIKQERLDEKGVDGMGVIIYKKLKDDFTNENLQEILAELYVYSKKNYLNYENIRLSDISSNGIWMTGDRLKKEFKELRYYNKNITQKIKEIYDSANKYYTQIGGKYIFDSRELVHCYKTYKSKNVNN